MSFISRCLQEKVKAGLIDKNFVADIEAKLKDAQTREAEGLLAKELADNAQLTLDASVKKSFNHLKNLQDVENLAKTGTEADIRAFFLENYKANIDARKSILGSHLKKYFNTYDDRILANPALKRANEMEIANVLWNKGGQTKEAIEIAAEMRKGLEHAHVMRSDAGEIVGQAADTTPKPAIFPEKLVKLSAEEFKSLVINSVDGEAFNKSIAPLVRKIGSVDEFWKQLRATYVSGFNPDLKVKPEELRAAFELALKPKDPQAYFKLSDALGSGSLGVDFAYNLDVVARQTGRLQYLGPNKGAAVELKNRLMKNAAGKFDDKTMRELSRDIDDRIKYAFGEFDRYPLDNPLYFAVTSGMQTLRNFASAKTAGLLPVQAISDPMLAKFAQKLYNVNGGNFDNYFKYLTDKPATKQRALEAAIMGDVLLDQIKNMYNAGPKIVQGSAKYARSAQMFGGMVRHTQAMQTSQSFLAMAKIGSLVNEVPFNKISDADMRFLKLANITEADWALLKTASDIGEGTNFVDVPKLAQSESLEVRRLAVKLDELVTRYRDLSAITGSAQMSLEKAKARNAGPLQGLMFDNVATFMSWPLEFTRQHVLKPFERGTKFGAEYVAALVAAAYAANLIGYYGRQALGGKNPDMSDPQAHLYALSNSVGIMGRFLTETFSAQYPNSASTLMGPAGQFPAAVYDAIANNAERAFDGKETKFTWDGFKAFWGLIPNVHPTKLVMDRMIYDKLQLMLDPKGQQNMRRKIKAQEKKGGYWWRPGDTLPE